MACFWEIIFVRAVSCTSSRVSLHSLSPSSFLSSSKCSSLKEDICTSNGITASAPYAKRNGVSPVAALWVVRYDQRMLGISSAHSPFFLSSFFLRASRIILLTASTCPLLSGCATEANFRLIFQRAQKALKEAQLNWGPLSATMVLGIPNRLMRFFQTNFSTLEALTRARSSASAHLVK